MTQYVYQRQRSRGGIPDVIFGLLIANGLVFALQQWIGDPIIQNFALFPISSRYGEFHVWQLLTYAFLHGSVLHIMFNMYVLWMLGRELEPLMGSQRFAIYYFTCAVGAGVVQLIASSLEGSGNPALGASGGVFGVLLAFGMAYPNRMLVLLFPPIPMKAKYFVLVLGLIELYLGFSGGSPGVANFAHLGGMLFGFLLIQYWKQQRRG